MVYSDDLKNLMREAGRQAAARREIVPHICAVCGKEYEAMKKSRYCSANCRQRAHRAKVKQQEGKNAE
jgi:predicted nucleic acid-binding Zn ribbon protein